MARPKKRALAKAYDAGQAAQVRGLPDEFCPFDPHTEAEERDAYFAGKSDELAEKFTLSPLGMIVKELGN